MESDSLLTGYASLFRSLGPNVTVVTATRRLARRLQHFHAEWRERRGETVWERPRILPWAAWLADWAERIRLEDTAPTLPRLLSAGETLALWEQVVRTPEAAGLLRPDGAARHARRARETMLAWCVPRSEVAQFAGEDSRTFLAWEAAFRDRLTAAGWIDADGLAPLLQQRVQGTGAPPDRVILAGFEDMTPSGKRLVATLAAAGCDITHWSPPPFPPRVAQVPAGDAEAELARFAAWSRDIVRRCPTARIGLVVPELAGRREEIERRLGDLLAPVAELPWREDSGRRPWHISLGRPLDQYPMVDDALRLLGLAEPDPALVEWGLLLRSPFLSGAAVEREARGELDVTLRRHGALQLSLTAVARLAAEPAPIFGDTLGRLQRAIVESGDGPALPSRWAGRFSLWLTAAGWPGEAALDSTEHQTAAALRETLSELARLDAVAGVLNRGQALTRLRRLTRQQVFQPAGDEAAPIQVMGLLETAGMRFDSLWVAGADDETWPEPLEPVELLPAPVLRRHGVPEADPAAALALAESRTARLCASAPEARWSWPRRDGERNLRPSPLVRSMPVAQDEPEAVTTWADVLFAAAASETLADHTGLPLAPGSRVSGGAAFFRDQAACPFRSYARHRLAAEPLDSGRLGLDARERGRLLHRVLERIWRELGAWDALDALTPGALSRRVAITVDAVVHELGNRREDLRTPRFAALERDRLRALVEEWLAVERQRAPFRVHATEQAGEAEVSGLRFHTRPDRIDALADGGHVIIDYKTGQPSPNHLGGDERPDDLQLALYARHHRFPVAAVLFARVRAGDCGFAGVARSRDLIPGARDPAGLVPGVENADWGQLERFWDHTLTTLADEGRAGHAPVTPKHGACDWCPLAGLCRIQEAAPTGGGDE